MRIKLTVQHEDGHALWTAQPTPEELALVSPYAVFSGADCPDKVKEIMLDTFKRLVEALKPN
jgi:hypothetical protein